MFVVSPMRDKNAGGVFSFAFDSDDLATAEKFAKTVTLTSWNLWNSVGCPSGFSGCEGLALYVHQSIDEDGSEFEPIAWYVQGRRFEPDHFDAR
jgi:hypothetical protein